MADKNTLGFGVPNVVAPHLFFVYIPASRTEPVVIIEDYGANGPAINSKPVPRVIVQRDAWRVVADPLRAYLNQRLKSKGFKGSRFAIGDNPVERLLGQEVAVLAWAIEKANEEEARIAFTRWATHGPEELHWLYQQIAMDAGRPEHEPTGWRLAIKQALIVKDDRPAFRRDIAGSKKSKTSEKGEQPSLFAA